MPLKYYCPKCSKRFVDWGAEKLDFKCPDCDGETLFRVGTQPENEEVKPSLSKSAAKRKRSTPAKAAAKSSDGDPDSNEPSGNDESADFDDSDDGDDISEDSIAIEDDD